MLRQLTKAWNSFDVDGKQKFVRAMFPEGLKFDGKKLEAHVTSILFKFSTHKNHRIMKWRTKQGQEVNHLVELINRFAALKQGENGD